MHVIIFGATGMVGQGVLRACVEDPVVTEVLIVGRTPSGVTAPKVREVLHADFLDFSALSHELGGWDACFYCLGVSSAGKTEREYRRVTRDMPLAAAEALLAQSPTMTFIYVSGAGADSSEKGRTMWARVKGEAENALARLPFKAVYVFRPAVIQPLHGARSKTRSYRLLYGILAPAAPLLKALFPRQFTTTERVGRAMIRAAREGAPKRILESSDIDRLGAV